MNLNGINKKNVMKNKKEIKRIVKEANQALYFAGFNKDKRYIIYENAFKSIELTLKLKRDK